MFTGGTVFTNGECFFNLPTTGLGPDERLARCAIRLSTQAFVVFLFRKER